MTQYIAFLRGINVGGIRIKMSDLSAMFTRLGMVDVRTVLNTGNVLFGANGASPAALKQSLERALSETFRYEAWVVLLEPAALREIVDAYPFDESAPTMQPYVMLTSDEGALADLLQLAPRLAPEQERIHPGKGVLYWEVRRGMSTDSVFSKESSKPRYKATTTTRNMRTLRKILALTR